jgi:hypothetical protein
MRPATSAPTGYQHTQILADYQVDRDVEAFAPGRQPGRIGVTAAE